MRSKGAWHGGRYNGALFGCQPSPTVQNRQHVAREAMYRPEPALSPSE
jgi:hypothetical protein